MVLEDTFFSLQKAKVPLDELLGSLSSTLHILNSTPVGANFRQGLKKSPRLSHAKSQVYPA
jgi:hypothetical protein